MGARDYVALVPDAHRPSHPARNPLHDIPSSTAMAPSQPRGTLPALFLGVLTVALDIALVATTLSSIRDSFGLDERSAAWILGVFVLFTLVGLPLMAKLSDRYGRRSVYLADLGLFMVGAVVVVSASSFRFLLLGRALQGLGASGIFPVASAVIGDTVAPERRGRMLGILGSVYGVAFIVGPILGGILVKFGWQWPFASNLVLAAVVMVIAPGRIPNRRAETRGELDWPGILVLGSLLALLSVGLNRIDTSAALESFVSWRVWPWLVTSAVLVPVFVFIERRAADPLLRLELITRRQVALVCVFAAGAGFVEAAFVFMADFASESMGVSNRTASFMLLPLVTAVAVASPVAGRIVDRAGSRLVIAAGLSLVAFGMGILAMAVPEPTTFYVGSVLIGFGLSCLLGSALSYILLAESEVSERTVAQGINTLFISVGQLVGSAVIGATAASATSASEGYREAFGLISVVMFASLALALLLKPRTVEQSQLARA